MYVVYGSCSKGKFGVKLKKKEEKAVAYFNLFFRQVQSCNKEPNDERAGKAKKTQLRNGIVSQLQFKLYDINSNNVISEISKYVKLEVGEALQD